MTKWTKEYKLSYIKQWAKDHPEKIKEYVKRYREKKKAKEELTNEEEIKNKEDEKK